MPTEAQVAVLLNVGGATVIDIYEQIKDKIRPTREEVEVQGTVQHVDVVRLENVLTAFDEYFEVFKNVTEFRHEFLTAKQGSSHIDEFILDLERKSKACHFCEPCRSTLVRDMIIVGTSNERVRKELLSIPNLDHATAINTARRLCQSGEVSSNLPSYAPPQPVPSTSGTMRTRLETETSDEIMDVNVVRRGNRTPRESTTKKFSTTRGGQSGGNRQSFRKPFGHCYRCGKSGHYANRCPTVNSLKNDEQEDHEEEIINALHINTVEKNTSTKQDDWTEPLEILKADGSRDIVINAQLDTGAQVNIIPVKDYLAMTTKPVLINTTNSRVYSYTGQELNILGVGTFRIKPLFGMCEKYLRFHVVDMDATPILGSKACEALGLVRRMRPQGVHKIAKMEWIQQYKKLFEADLGRLPVAHHITLQELPKEQIISPPAPVPLAYQRDVKEKLSEMERAGVISKISKPTRFVHRMVTVIKKDGSVRLCLDPRRLNAIIEKKKFPLPRAEDLFTKLNGAQYFSTLDATNAFWQVPLDEQSSELCTFATPWGRFKFNVLPFGICDASEVFQEITANLFGDLDGVINYIDDFVIHAPTRAEHDRRLKAFLDRCQTVGLRLTPGKACIAMDSVVFLGHRIAKAGISIVQDRIEAIMKFTPPADVSALRGFLGMLNYLARFIPDLSSRSAPLRHLTRKGVPFNWDANHQKIFNDLKKSLSTAPVLAHFDSTKPVDASSYGLGAVLMQEGRPCGYASSALSETQKRYAQIERELLAIVFGLEHFKYFITGLKINVETDHRPLLGLFKKDISDLSPRLQKLMLRTLGYDFTLQYVPGKELYVADCLSRSPLPSPNVATQDIDCAQNRVFAMVEINPEKEKIIMQDTKDDEELEAVRRHIQNGWPNHKRNVRKNATRYWLVASELSEEGGLIYCGRRLVIPKNSRGLVLGCLHKAHQGQTTMYRKAR